MKRIFLVLVLLVMGSSPAAAQQSVSVAELLEGAVDHESRVIITGELIGDYGFRNDGSMWTQLNDDGYVFAPILEGGDLVGGNIGVAVRIPGELAVGLDPPGGYRIRGPVVELTGVWEYHDPDLGGETYVDVLELTVIEPGRKLQEHPNYLALAAALALLVGTVLASRRGVPRKRYRMRNP